MAHHVQGGEGVERLGGRGVLLVEQAHDDRQRDALLVEVHGLGLAQHVAVDALGHRGASLPGGVGGVLEYRGDRVGRQPGGLAVVVAVEQRPVRRQSSAVGVNSCR